jgi:nitroreductase
MARNMTSPGPDDSQLETLLEIGARVPDHGKLNPWRFIVFRGQARADFGTELAAIFKQNNPDADAATLAVEQQRFCRAPLVLAICSAPCAHPKIPLWEQQLSAGAACQNILVAAQSMGFAAQWLTEWPAYDEQVKRLLDLSEPARIAGFIYIGTAIEPPKERARPELSEISRDWKAS